MPPENVIAADELLYDLRTSKTGSRPHRQSRGSRQASVRRGPHSGRQVMGATRAGALGQGFRVAGRPKGERGRGLRVSPKPPSQCSPGRASMRNQKLTGLLLVSLVSFTPVQ